ncbi:Retrovirus-related Pol polyprotein from transposon opus [Ceratobasidium sp. AG-Ba]|nr:Retrovirus-related Pol polyprotein from transposon opus [Ceratobasidium sp. AG-Ba]
MAKHSPPQLMLDSSDPSFLAQVLHLLPTLRDSVVHFGHYVRAPEDGRAFMGGTCSGGIDRGVWQSCRRSHDLYLVFRIFISSTITVVIVACPSLAVSPSATAVAAVAAPLQHAYHAYSPLPALTATQPRTAPPVAAGTTVAQHQRPAAALPKPTPQIHCTPATPRPHTSKDQPPHFPALPPVPATPSQTPAQPARARQPATILEQAPPPVSAEFIEKLRAIQNPNALMPELVAADTPENHAAYRANVLQFEQDHGDQGPWLTRPYPLSPGTFKQTLNLCTVCARGSHPAHKCPAEAKGESIPRPEQIFRNMLWNTPTPAQRVKDVQHVEFVDDVGPEDEWEQYEGYELGNEGGQRA